MIPGLRSPGGGSYHRVLALRGQRPLARSGTSKATPIQDRQCLPATAPDNVQGTHFEPRDRSVLECFSLARVDRMAVPDLDHEEQSVRPCAAHGEIRHNAAAFDSSALLEIDPTARSSGQYLLRSAVNQAGVKPAEQPLFCTELERQAIDGASMCRLWSRPAFEGRSTRSRRPFVAQEVLTVV